MASVTSPGNGAASARTVSYGYTTDGSYSQDAALGEPITVTNELGKTWHLRYDARGNLVEAWDPLGNTADALFNRADQPVAEMAPATGSTGNGRSSGLTTYLYVGGPATREDAKDESGNVVRTVSVAYGPEGETLSRTGSAEAVSVAYDGAYATKALTDGNGHATSYSYDGNGRPTGIDYPGATGSNYDRVRFTGYDAVGNLLSRTDGNGQATTYAYGDGDGLLTSVAYPGVTASNVGVSYDAYDRATSATDGAGTASSTYDDGGRVLTGTRTYAGVPTKTFSYAYWPDGSRQTMANPAGTWSYAYDAAGRYASMSSPAGTSSATYLDNGWQASRTLPNGVATSYAYNAVGSLTGQLSQTAGAATLSQYGNFAYDGVFNLTGITASVPGASAQGGATTYAYDAKDRLTQESSSRLGGYTQNEAYDAAGNPTTLRGAAGAFDADNRRTGTGFAYDGNGSPTTYRGTAMAYDPEARATQLGTLTTGYRADGLRAWKQAGSGARTYFLYDGGEPVLELDASGAVVATNVRAPDGLVARGTASGWTQYCFDAEGSVAQRLSASGGVLTNSAYDAYGAASTSGTAASDPFGCHARSGYYLDAETGLYLCRHRYYDPQAGRWVTRDPIGYEGGINLYGYCEGGPVGRSDPSGLQTHNCEHEPEGCTTNGVSGGGPLGTPDGPSYRAPEGEEGVPGGSGAPIAGGGDPDPIVFPGAPEGDMAPNTQDVGGASASGPLVSTNKEEGLQTETSIIADLRKFGVDARPGPRSGIRVPATGKYPAGRRFPDIAIYNESGDLNCYIAVKLGESEYRGRQRARDAWMENNYGTATWLWRVPR